MKIRHFIAVIVTCLLSGGLLAGDAWAQRGGRGGGGGGGRSAGNRPAGGGGGGANRSPSMSRPGGSPSAMQRPAAASGGVQRPAGAPGGAQPRPAGNPGGVQRPAGAPGTAGIQRPNAAPGGVQRPNAGAVGIQRPNAAPGGVQRPNAAPGAAQRPNSPAGGIQRPNATPANLPANAGGRSSSAQLNEFLGGGPPATGGAAAGLGQRPNAPNLPNAGDRPNLRNNIGDRNNNIGDRTNNIGDRTNNIGNRTNVGGGNNVTNVNVGDINVGNRVSYADNSQTWVSQRQNWGNNVRTGVGPRYNNVFNQDFYRRRPIGGYNYYGGWVNRGPNYAWTAATWAGVGALLGASIANSQPTYYAYGQGGNVYYENNVVYMNGQPAGTPQEYYQQVQTIAAAAPPADQVDAQPEDWMPLGVFAVTSEDVPDSQSAMQLAVNKQGVFAGSFYNEADQSPRPIQGSLDPQTQRVVLTFADAQENSPILETGLSNLTEDQAPALLHFGPDQSQPILLVRLPAPENDAPAAAPPGN